MKTRFIIISLLALICFSFTQSVQKRFLIVENTAFDLGEKLTYRLHYGIFNAGIGTLEVSPKKYRVNDRVCYKYTIHGQSVGTFATFMKIEDWFISYADTANLHPQLFYRDIEENKYNLKERTLFNQNDTVTTVTRWDKDHPEKKTKSYNTAKNLHDLVSGFYFLRNIDYSKVNEGDVIEIWGFFENDYYKLKIRYRGKEKVKTDAGKFNALRFTPIMPENSLFDGENSIEFWLSDDENKIPVKCKAHMFVGAVELELKDYSGLRHNINKL